MTVIPAQTVGWLLRVLCELASAGCVANHLGQQADVAVVDAGDGRAEVDGCWSARLAASRNIRCLFFCLL